MLQEQRISYDSVSIKTIQDAWVKNVNTQDKLLEQDLKEKGFKIYLLEEMDLQFDRHDTQGAIKKFEEYIKQSKVHCKGQKFRAHFEELTKRLYQRATIFMKTKKFDDAYLILSLIEDLTSSDEFNDLIDIRVLAFNYLGCYYRRLGKLELAKQNLKQALKLVEQNGAMKYCVMTYINLSAVLSSLGERKVALEYALVGKTNSLKEINSMLSSTEVSQLKKNLEFKETVNLYAIAQFHIGLEYGIDADSVRATKCFEKALKILKEYNGTNNFLYKIILSHLNARAEKSENREKPGLTQSHVGANVNPRAVATGIYNFHPSALAIGTKSGNIRSAIDTETTQNYIRRPFGYNSKCAACFPTKNTFFKQYCALPKGEERPHSCKDANQLKETFVREYLPVLPACEPCRSKAEFIAFQEREINRMKDEIMNLEEINKKQNKFYKGLLRLILIINRLEKKKLSQGFSFYAKAYAYSAISKPKDKKTFPGDTQETDKIPTPGSPLQDPKADKAEKTLPDNPDPKPEISVAESQTSAQLGYHLTTAILLGKLRQYKARLKGVLAILKRKLNEDTDVTEKKVTEVFPKVQVDPVYTVSRKGLLPNYLIAFILQGKLNKYRISLKEFIITLRRKLLINSQIVKKRSKSCIDSGLETNEKCLKSVAFPRINFLLAFILQGKLKQLKAKLREFILEFRRKRNRSYIATIDSTKKIDNQYKQPQLQSWLLAFVLQGKLNQYKIRLGELVLLFRKKLILNSEFLKSKKLTSGCTLLNAIHKFHLRRLFLFRLKQGLRYAKGRTKVEELLKTRLQKIIEKWRLNPYLTKFMEEIPIYYSSERKILIDVFFANGVYKDQKFKILIKVIDWNKKFIIDIPKKFYDYIGFPGKDKFNLEKFHLIIVLGINVIENKKIINFSINQQNLPSFELGNRQACTETRCQACAETRCQACAENNCQRTETNCQACAETKCQACSEIKSQACSEIKCQACSELKCATCQLTKDPNFLEKDDPTSPGINSPGGIELKESSFLVPKVLDFKIFTEVFPGRAQFRGAVHLVYFEEKQVLALVGSFFETKPLLLRMSSPFNINNKQTLSNLMRDGVIIWEDKILLEKEWSNYCEANEAMKEVLYRKNENDELFLELCLEKINHKFISYNNEVKEYKFSIAVTEKAYDKLVFEVSKLPAAERKTLAENLINENRDIKAILTSLNFEGELVNQYFAKFEEDKISKDCVELCKRFFGLIRGQLEFENEIELWQYLEAFNFEFRRKFSEQEIEDRLKKINPIAHLFISKELKIAPMRLRLSEVISKIETLIENAMSKESKLLLKSLISLDLRPNFGKLDAQKPVFLQSTAFDEKYFAVLEPYFSERHVSVNYLKMMTGKFAIIDKGKMFETCNKFYSKGIDPVIKIEKKVKKFLKERALGSMDYVDIDFIEEFFMQLFRDDNILAQLEIKEFARQTCEENRFPIKHLYQFINPRRDIDSYLIMIKYLESKKKVFVPYLKSKEGRVSMHKDKFKELLFYCFPGLTSSLVKYLILHKCKFIRSIYSIASEEFLYLLEVQKIPNPLNREIISDEAVGNIDFRFLESGKINKKYLKDFVSLSTVESEHISILAKIANENKINNSSVFLVDLVSSRYHTRMKKAVANINDRMIESSRKNQIFNETNLAELYNILIEHTTEFCAPLVSKLIYEHKLSCIEEVLAAARKDSLVFPKYVKFVKYDTPEERTRKAKEFTERNIKLSAAQDILYYSTADYDPVSNDFQNLEEMN